MKSVLHILNKIIDGLGWVCMVAMLLMIFNVCIDVFVRYVVVETLKSFDLYLWYDKYLYWLGGVGMQELEWHWFSIMFLLGMGYTLRENGHVRVDVFYDNFSRKTQAMINILGGLIFTIPVCLLILYFTWDFFVEAWVNQENRGDPGSLTRLWPVKLVLPVSFFFLILSCIAVIIQESFVFIEKDKEMQS